ncbi:hypothetical protein [Fluviicola sp.]|uniref:hypothetical protein n=1 Tax=Fluviicola sp. TaxID=1917219 RepID=UPI0031D094C4
MNNELNAFLYFNYDVIWCKVFEIRPVEEISETDERTNELIRSYRANPSNDELAMRLFDVFIEGALGTVHTPEDFNYDLLLGTEWRHIPQPEAESFTDLLITESEKTHTHYLEEHETINNDPLEWKASNKWVDYSQVKELFFGKTFNAESVQFYTNSSPADFETNRYEYPCIIAIDGNQIGFLWFMT